ncbi:HAD family phosphatase [Streptomyces sp. NPDC047860]|uniref:HAD family hydrolase n=1 Tax=Streptomyces sp. NPDC047860 TaxID=3155743 RepID=UPI003405C68A
MSPRAVLLDFDGLICDTERAARRSWEETWADCGLRFPDDVWGRMQGRPGGEAIALDALERALGKPVGADVRIRRRLRKQQLGEREPLRPGVAGLLEAARLRGIALAVVSSGHADWVEGHLARLGVRDRFAFVLSGDDVARHKPAPDVYLAALERLGVAARDALALEDSAVGIRAAHAAGVRCVAVPSAAGDRALLTEADLVVASAGAHVLDAAPYETSSR